MLDQEPSDNGTFAARIIDGIDLRSDANTPIKNNPLPKSFITQENLGICFYLQTGKSAPPLQLLANQLEDAAEKEAAQNGEEALSFGRGVICKNDGYVADFQQIIPVCFPVLKAIRWSKDSVSVCQISREQSRKYKNRLEEIGAHIKDINGRNLVAVRCPKQYCLPCAS